MTSFWFGDWWGAQYSATWWGDTSGPTPPPVVTESSSGGWRMPRHQSPDEIRRERERLGILPKQSKIIDKALARFEERVEGGLADTLRAEPARDVLAYIEESQEYRALLSRLAIEAEAKRQAVADYIAQAMLAFVMAQRQEEDDILVIMMMAH